MKQSGTSTRLTGAVQDIASEVVSALRGGDHLRLADSLWRGDEAGASGDLALAAVRVLGADVLLPSVLGSAPADPEDLAVVRKAVEAFPPTEGASPTSQWSHWATRRTLLRLDVPLDGARADGAEPPADWLDDAPWQFLTHQLAVLAPLALPALPAHDCAVTRAARSRPVDVARGFVRAVRRRDWLQAAGAARWLTVLDGVPDTLGLEAGLEFVDHMGGEDPRVALQVQAARLLRTGAPG